MQQTPISSSTPPVNGPAVHHQQIIGQQSYIPSRYDEAERLRQRMQDLRKHHYDSNSRHEQTQPIIDKHIHEETVRYLKSTQVTGTKAKLQKPRATKRAKTSATSLAATSSNAPIATKITDTDTTKNLQTEVVEANVIEQQHNQRNDYKYQQTDSFYHQMPNIQPHLNHAQYPLPAGQHQANNHQQHIYNSHHHDQQQQHHHQVTQRQPSLQPSQPTPIRLINGQHNHYGYEQNYNTQFSQSYYSHARQNALENFTPVTPNRLPTDLNFNLEAGLECDVDSLINYEMSMGGQLDFDHGLLLKLDNPPPHQH